MRLCKRLDPRRCAFEVHDGCGDLLFTLPFEEVLESCRDRAPVHQNIRQTMRETQAAYADLMRKRSDFLRALDDTRQTLQESTALMARTF